MTPLVSVLLPAFDAASTLAAALASVARQTLADFECIVVDDGSGDDTAAIARAQEARDGRFRVERQEHAGIVTALRRGLHHCRGRYIARMDADDLAHRDRLRLQVEWLERTAARGSRLPRAGLSARASGTTFELERWLGRSSLARRAAGADRLPRPASPLLLRTDAFAGPPRRYLAQGHDLVLRLLASGREIGVVPRRLLCWRDSSARLTRTDPRCSLERITACKASFLAEGLLRASDGYLLWGYGSTGRAMRRALLAHGKRPSHVIEVHPRRLGERIHGAEVVGPDAIADLPRRPLVASVAGAEPRRLIRDHLEKLGWEETRDFVCVA